MSTEKHNSSMVFKEHLNNIVCLQVPEWQFEGCLSRGNWSPHLTPETTTFLTFSNTFIIPFNLSHMHFYGIFLPLNEILHILLDI